MHYLFRVLKILFKTYYTKTIIQATILIFPAFLFSQQKNLDQLEQRLNELRNTNPEEVITIGNYILSHSTSERQKSNTLVLMSFAYYAKKDNKKFTELLFNAKELAENTKDPEVTGRIYGTIAQMYLNMQFKDKAADYLQKAVNEIKRMPEGDDRHKLTGLTYIELGKISLDDKTADSANIFFKSSLHEFNKINKNATYFIKRSYYNIGNCFYEMQRLDSARLYLNKALEIKENQVVNQYALLTLANIYNREKQYQRAVDTLLSVLGRTDLANDTFKSEVYLAILKNYNALGNIEKYNLYNEKYLALQSRVSDNNLNTIKHVIKIEEQGFAKKIASEKRQNNRLIILLVLVFILSAAILVYIRRKKKVQKKQYEAIIRQLEKSAEDNSYPHHKGQPLKDPGNQSIPAEIEQGILEKLARFEQSERFTNPKLNIATLAVQLKTNTTYLSQVINKYKGKNFNMYINELRINYICQKIHNNPQYLSYKISYLGELAGFTSHSTFTTVFKSVTGISPSFFLKEAEKSTKTKNTHK